MVSQHFVELTLTAAGTVEAFDASSFKASLAASVGVTPADITLVVAAASVRVVATIRIAAAAAVTGVASTLQAAAADPSALSELVGVRVLSAAAPVVLVRLVAVAPPPALPPASEVLETSAEQADPGGDEIEGAVLAIAVGVPLGGLLLCVALVAFLFRRAKRGRTGAARELPSTFVAIQNIAQQPAIIVAGSPVVHETGWSNPHDTELVTPNPLARPSTSGGRDSPPPYEKDL